MIPDKRAPGGILLSAVVVNWNHGDFIPACLHALTTDGKALLSAGALEIVVVDNGSTDRSPEWLARAYPALRLLRFDENHGFAYALNRGIRSTSGAFVLSLNPDVVIRPGFLQALIEGIQKPPFTTKTHVGMAAPKLLRADAPGRLDSTGLFVDRRRRPYDRGQGEVDRGQYDGLTDVFGPCGAAALYRREMLEDVADPTQPDEYLDELFFAYCEDADLAWRAQLRGWRCVYVPTATATHVRGWGDALLKPGHARKGTRGPRLALRNRYLMTLKNDTWQHTVRDLPHILAAELPRLAYLAFTRPGVLLALTDLARACPSALRKRRRIRSRQLVGDATLRAWFIPPKSQHLNPSQSAW